MALRKIGSRNPNDYSCKQDNLAFLSLLLLSLYTYVKRNEEAGQMLELRKQPILQNNRCNPSKQDKRNIVMDKGWYTGIPNMVVLAIGI